MSSSLYSKFDYIYLHFEKKENLYISNHNYVTIFPSKTKEAKSKEMYMVQVGMK